jgi:hypothetical protein
LTIDTVVLGTTKTLGSTISSHRIQARFGAFQKTRHTAFGHVELDTLTFIAFRSLV